MIKPMTSDEIRKVSPTPKDYGSESFEARQILWLREIALQLSISNENKLTFDAGEKSDASKESKHALCAICDHPEHLHFDRGCTGRITGFANMKTCVCPRFHTIKNTEG